MEIKGKIVGVKFNNYAIEQLTTLKNLGQSQWGFLYGLTYAGYQGWKIIRENQPGFEDPGITFEDVVEWVDSSATDTEVAREVANVFNAYQDSQAYKRLIQKQEDEEKKRLTETSATSTNSLSASLD